MVVVMSSNCPKTTFLKKKITQLVLQKKKIPSTQQLRNKYAKWGWASFLLCGYFLGFFGFRVPEASLCTTLTPKVQKSPESGKKQKKKTCFAGENSKVFCRDDHRIGCTVLYCTVLYCTVLYCTVLYCTVLYCTVLYCTVLYCTVLYCTVLYCTVLYCTVLYCTVLYCTVLYCTVLYCTVKSCESCKKL